MTLRVEKIILNSKYNTVDSYRKMYIQKNIQDPYSEQQLDYFLSKLTGDELLYAIEFKRIFDKEKRKIVGY